MNTQLRLGFLASHRGSNMQAIIDACKLGTLAATPVLVISNNLDSGALLRARQEHLAALHLSTRTHPDPTALDQAIADALVDHGVDLVVLAGYMRRLGPQTLTRYAGHLINIHPSLLPKYGGVGMYGDKVHAAVLAAGESASGATVHAVTANYDEGPVLAQTRVTVFPNDTVASLAARVLEQEHLLYVATLGRIVSGEIPLPIVPAP
jgi:phosphoribosylglycinamide formyltransferase 1